MKKILLTAGLVCAGFMVANAQLIKDDFLAGYGIGTDLEKGQYANTTQGEGTPIMVDQWNRSGKDNANDQSGENPQTVPALSYDGYVGSDKDVAIALAKLETGGRTTIYSLASDNTYGAGTYYVSFLINVTAASPTSGQEFFALDGNYTGNAQRARFGVKRTDAEATTYMIGLGDGSAPAANAFSGSFDFGTTYLAVMKVELTDDGTGLGTGGGTTSVFINPDVNATEPATAFATSPITGTALKAIRGLVVRQRSTIEAEIGGFRFAKTWSDALGQGGSSINNVDADKGEVVSTTYFTVTGAAVSNPAAGIFIKKTAYANGSTDVEKVILK